MKEFIPIGARMVIEESKDPQRVGAIEIPGMAQKVKIATVVAVGQGSFSFTGERIPMDVHMGDEVAYLEGVEAQIPMHTEDGVKFMSMIDEANVIGIYREAK